MTESRRASVLAAILVSMILVVSACGGATATSTPVPAGEATPTPVGEVTPTPVGEATPPEVGAIPTFDLNALTGGIPGVDSYRTETSVSGVKQYETVVVKAPVFSKSITVFDGGEISGRYLVIGDEAWQANGATDPYEPIPGGAQVAATMLMVFDPALMLGGFAGIDWAQAAADLGSQEKNGVAARHVRIDSTTAVGLAAAMPPGAAIDAWVADAGYLVAWEMSGFPEDANFSINVTNVNDPANKVEPPS